MTSRKKFTHESQDAQRKDKHDAAHNPTHKSDKHHEKHQHHDKRK